MLVGKTLTQTIHADLQAQGLMAVEPRPTRDQLLGRAKLGRHGAKRMPWEAPFGKQPRDYAVTAVIPHCGTPKLLELCIAFLLRQTIPVYIVVVDTGTAEALLPDVLALRGERVEVHQVNCHGTDHAVASACYAMDLGTTLCRTEYLWCVHSDCFVTRRTLLAELLTQADGGKNPCIGYQTIPKPQSPGFDCSKMVSHTCTLLHVPTLDELDVTWSMRRLQRQAKVAGRPIELDTEMALNYRLLDRGVKPIILGPETLDAIEIDANRVHLRAATARGLYLANGRDDSEIVERLEKLLMDDGDVLPEQERKEEKGGNGKREKGDSKFPLPPFASSPFPSFPRPTRLNLIYHVAPFAKSDVWRKNIRQLLRRIDLFNWRRVVAIAIGEGMAPPSEVHRAFAEGWPSARIARRRPPNILAARSRPGTSPALLSGFATTHFLGKGQKSGVLRPLCPFRRFRPSRTRTVARTKRTERTKRTPLPVIQHVAIGAMFRRTAGASRRTRPRCSILKNRAAWRWTSRPTPTIRRVTRRSFVSPTTAAPALRPRWRSSWAEAARLPRASPAGAIGGGCREEEYRRLLLERAAAAGAVRPAGR